MKMSVCDKVALLCLCLIFTTECSAGFFDGNTKTTPSVKIIPEADGNFIYFNYSAESAEVYIDSMNKFLDGYKNPESVENLRQCDFYNPATENNFCNFDVRTIDSNCSPSNNFGFIKGSPCFLFTLSQVLNWTPVVLNGSDIQRHSDPFLNIPSHLNASIAFCEKEKPSEKYVWLTCDGDIGADKEFIGPISYYPQNGFPTYYFPFKNVKGYQSPIVAVHFRRPTRGVAITIICKAWAKNIQLDEKNELGFVKFQLLID